MILSALERRESIENPATPLSRIFDIMDGTPADSGVRVGAQSAMTSTAYFSAIRFIAETIAGLTLKLERRVESGRERIRDDPRVDVFTHISNPEMTAYTLRETATGHMASWGNAYFEKVYTNGGKLDQVWPLLPDRTYRELIDGRVTYVTQIDGRYIRLPADRVMHIPGFGFDGRTGYSLIQIHKQALGIALASDKHAAKFFGNGMRASGVLTVPAALTPTTRTKMRQAVEEQIGGLTNAQRLLILEGGVSFENMGIPPGDAQFLESRKFQVVEMSRITRLPPHVLYDLERATFSNIEQQSLELVIYSLTPWARRWEEGLKKDTLTPVERRELQWKLDMRSLLRGDSEARTKYYRERFQLGSLSPNQVRELEDENRIDEPGADEVFVNAAMIPLSKALEMSVDERAKILGAMNGTPKDDASPAPLIRDAWGRMVRAELRDLKRLLQKDGSLKDYYENEFEGFASKMLQPVADATGEDVQALVARYAYDARRTLEDLAGDQVGAILGSWESRADTWAQEAIE